MKVKLTILWCLQSFKEVSVGTIMKDCGAETKPDEASDNAFYMRVGSPQSFDAGDAFASSLPISQFWGAPPGGEGLQGGEGVRSS